MQNLGGQTECIMGNWKIVNNAPYLPPVKFCLTFVFHFFWVLQPSQQKLKTMLMQMQLEIRNPWLWYPRYSSMNLACAPDETTLWLSPSAKQRWNPCSRPYQDLSKRHDSAYLKSHHQICQSVWREIRNAFLVIFSSLLEAQNKDFGAASQTLLTRVKLRLQRRLKESGIPQTIGVQNPSSTDKDWNPVPGIRTLESVAWNLEFKTVLDTLIGGD